MLVTKTVKGYQSVDQMTPQNCQAFESSNFDCGQSYTNNTPTHTFTGGQLYWSFIGFSPYCFEGLNEKGPPTTSRGHPNKMKQLKLLVG